MQLRSLYERDAIGQLVCERVDNKTGSMHSNRMAKVICKGTRIEKSHHNFALVLELNSTCLRRCGAFRLLRLGSGSSGGGGAVVIVIKPWHHEANGDELRANARAHPHVGLLLLAWFRRGREGGGELGSN